MRLTVLGGYLGSGKSTWLRHQLYARTFGRVHVIVNEAAEVPVDDVLLGAAQNLTVLAGGCVCCDAREALISALRDLCDRRTRAGADPVDHIVLETSGLADPAPIVTAFLKDPILVHHIVLSEIVVAVDGMHALEQLRDAPLGRQQIEAADRLILTKSDIAPAGSLAQLIATLRRLNPGASIGAAHKGTQVPLPEVPLGTKVAVLPDSHSQEPVTPTRLQIDPAIDWTAFCVWLSALLHARGHDIVRVKGVVQTPSGRLLVQSVRRIVQSPEILPANTAGDAANDNVVVFIGRGFCHDDLQRSLEYFAGHTP
ncbi:MAG: G3E family GTPase [Paracoccaceae bacterium]|jgi:G3E family GTPase